MFDCITNVRFIIFTDTRIFSLLCNIPICKEALITGYEDHRRHLIELTRVCRFGLGLTTSGGRVGF